MALFGSKTSSPEELFQTRLNRRQYKKWRKDMYRKTETLGLRR